MYPARGWRKMPTALFDYRYDDVDVVDYRHHPAIKAPVAV